jgi:sugar phosphate isomerase/epimerase
MREGNMRPARHKTVMAPGYSRRDTAWEKTMNVPVIGAALTVAELNTYHDWILEKDRDLELQSFIDASVLDSDWTPLADEVKRLLKGYKGRMGIHGPFWGFTIDTQEPLVRDVVQKRFGQGLDVCAAINATHMVIHSPFTTWEYNNLDGHTGDRDKLFTRVHQVLDPIVQRAETLGVTLVMENIEDINPADRKLLCESFGSSALQVSIDTGHAHYAHGSTGAPPVDYFVKSAGDLLAHVHLQDADGYADRHWQIGQGTILWPSVFAALAELTATPRLLLELLDNSGIPASMAYLVAKGLGQ